MKIKNAKYINIQGTDIVNILVTDDVNGTDIVRSVPQDEANTDYQNILQWVADGNTIQEAD
jgi:hypothetical protein